MTKPFTTLFAGIVLAGLAAASNASSVTFATFEQTDPSQLGVSYAATAPPGTSTLQSVKNLPVQLTFGSLLNGALLPGVALSTPYSAILTLTATTSLGDNGLPYYDSAADGVRFSFKAVGGPLNGKILLAGTAGIDTPGVPAFLTGQAGNLTAGDGDQSGGLSGSNLPSTSYTQPNFVRFTSQVINTAKLTDENYSFNLSGATPPFSYTAGPVVDYLNSFEASINGEFAAAFVPEPGSIALSMSALVSVGALSLRRRRRK